MFINSRIWLAFASLGFFSGVIIQRSRNGRRLQQAEREQMENEADRAIPENQEAATKDTPRKPAKYRPL